jgi:hypothetical protein
MVDSKDTIWSRLVALVSEIPTIGSRRIFGSKEFTRSTNLVSDLGLIGDDAYEFMEKYASVFDVRRGDFEPSNYFYSEGLWILPRLKRQKPKLPITLGMLELAARDGEWNSAKLSETLSSSV